MNAAGAMTSSRVLLRNVPWEVYEALLAARGDDPVPRFAYDRGLLEIMSPSSRHEWVKKLTARLIEAYTEERGIGIKSAGSTTLKSQLKEKGLEPDESYYVQNEALVRFRDDLDLTFDPPPDFAVEIDVASSSLDKLELYASLGIREVWSYDGGLVIHLASASGWMAPAERGRALPDLAVSDIQRFLAARGTLDETGLVRSFRAWVREQPAAG